MSDSSDYEDVDVDFASSSSEEIFTPPNNRNQNEGGASSQDGGSSNTQSVSSPGMEPQQVNEIINNGPLTRARRRMLQEAVLPSSGTQVSANTGRSGFYFGARQNSTQLTDSVPKRPWTSSEGSRGGGRGPKSGRYYYSAQSTSVQSSASRSDQARRLHETISQRRNLLAEQNQAYEESLRADQERERIKKEKEKAEKEKEEAEKEKQKKLKDRKQLAREMLPEEPKEGEGVITLAFRLLSGATVRRNFLFTDTIFTLHQFVLGQDETPMQYELVRHPNQRIPSEESTEAEMTLQQYGFKKEMLYVHHKTASNNGSGDS